MCRTYGRVPTSFMPCDWVERGTPFPRNSEEEHEQSSERDRGNVRKDAACGWFREPEPGDDGAVTLRGVLRGRRGMFGIGGTCASCAESPYRAERQQRAHRRSERHVAAL